MSNNLEWRQIRKFPGFEVSTTLLVRSSSTKRIVRQRVEPFAAERRSKVILPRNGFTTEAFVHELFLTAFPEKAAEYYQKREAA